MATFSQTIANRLNALKSTGPRTSGGKERSRRNALRHGLSRIGSVLPGEMADAIADRKEAWHASYSPDGPAQDWLFERLVAESVRLDACERRLIVLRAELADRAAESWDDDRAALIAELAATLPRRPEVIQPKLLQSKHGVLWMLRRWDDVAASLDRCKGWSPETWDLAMDLLGVPPASRAGSGPWDLDPSDPSEAPGLELVRGAVDSLRERLDSHLDERDARARLDAEAGLIDPADAPSVRLVERYAADARRQFSRCLNELRRLQAIQAPARSARDATATSHSAPARSGPPGPRPDRSASKSKPASASATASPPPGPGSNPSPDTSTAPDGAPTTKSNPNPNPGRSPILPAGSPFGRLAGQPVAANRRARRAQAAASRRS
jgi:hypothetical protein